MMSGVISTLDIVVICAYFVLILAIGIYVGVVRAPGEDFFRGGTRFGWPTVGLSIWGTNVGPSFLIASSSAAYTSGMVAANFEWMACIFLALLAMVFAPLYLRSGIATVPQIVERRFGTGAYRILTVYSLYTIVMLWLGGALYTGGLLVAQVLGVSPTAAIIALMIIAVIIAMVGGLTAVMVTDSFQTVLIIVAAIALVGIGLWEIGGVAPLIAQVPAESWSLVRPLDSPDYPWLALVLGYPVLGIWFWCSDQTIVQRIFAARNLQEAQRGVLFAAFLKILPPFLFILPGIMAFVLHPDLADPDMAFTTMVTEYLPAGLRGLVLAALIAALITTVDSGLNSFSTLFTLDIYEPLVGKKRTIEDAELRKVGRISTLAAGIGATIWAIALGSFESNLFDLLQQIIGFLAPPMTALFLLGLFWKKATSVGIMGGFVISAIACQTIGVLYAQGVTIGPIEQWPHFLYLSFGLFVATMGLMAGWSLVTARQGNAYAKPLVQSVAASGSKSMWLAWAMLGAVIVAIYIAFESLAARANTADQQDGPWPSQAHIFLGDSATLDGIIAQGEWDDATVIAAPAMQGWNAQFSPVERAEDLSATVLLKHDGQAIYIAFQVTDDMIYGIDTASWLPDENLQAHAMTPAGWPWFGDGVEVLLNAAGKWSLSDGETNAGDASSWQIVVNTHRSWLGGMEVPGLMFGEQREDPQTFSNHVRWIEEGLLQAAVLVDAAASPRRYVVEMRIDAAVLETKPGVPWTPDMGSTTMGLNLAIGDLDDKTAGAGNFANFHHENWWAGERDKRTWLKQWGSLIVHPQTRQGFLGQADNPCASGANCWYHAMAKSLPQNPDR